MEIEGQTANLGEQVSLSADAEYLGADPWEQAFPVFNDLITYFNGVEMMSNSDFQVPDWRKTLSRARDGGHPAEGFKSVALLLNELEKNQGHDVLSEPTQILLGGSKYEPWRLFYGRVGLLDFYLDIFNKYRQGDEWDTPALKLIGNCCVDYDENRDRVLAKLDLSILIKAFRSPQLAPLPLIALYSICRDYDPAERIVRSHGLFEQVLAMFDDESDPFDISLLSYVSPLLEIAIEEFDANDLSEYAIEIIYQTTRYGESELDDEMTLYKAILALLEHERYQKILIAHGEMPLLMTLFIDTHHLNSTDLFVYKQVEALGLDPRQTERIRDVRSAASQRLWDLTTLPEFATRYPPGSDVVQQTCVWLSLPAPEFQICACNMLRNVASSEQTSTQFLHFEKKDQLMKPLLDLLRKPIDPQISQEGLRLLRNLAVPHANKDILTTNFKVLDVVMPLCSNSQSLAVCCTAIGVLRQLLTGSSVSVLRFLYTDEHCSTPSTNLTNLLNAFDEHQDLTLRMEVARLIVGIWRLAHQIDESSGIAITDQATRQTLDANLNLITPICAMIKDSENESLVTEGWFGLTLVASSPAGADMVCETICRSPTFDRCRDIIMELTAGSPNRNNATVLCDKLIKHNLDINQPDRVAVLEALFRGVRSGTKDFGKK